MREIEQVVRFLLGEGEIDGFSYGERPAAKPNFWWRKNLRSAFEKHKAELEALRKTAQYWKEQARSITDYSETQQKEIRELRARVAELESLSVCPTCNGDAFIPIYCCSGIECGCMSRPIDFRECETCNKDGGKTPSKTLAEYCPFLLKPTQEGE